MSGGWRDVARRALGRPPRQRLLESDRFALDPRLDLDAEQLALHRRAVERWRTGAGGAPATVLWLIPAFEHGAYGGIRTILRFADGLVRRHGARAAFYVWDAPRAQALAVGPRIAQAFPALAGAPVHGADEPLPACDAAVATFWPTAYLAARLPETAARFLFLQDRESAFYAAGSAAALAEQTLALGLPAIVNSPALRELAGEESVVFTPSVDTELFHPPAAPRPDRPVRIVLYARPSAQRNAFGLGMAALRRLKSRYGDRVELLAAGEAWDPRALGVPEGVVRNLGLLEDLDAVAELYRSCHAGLFFMMTPHASYQPLELMASGAACVSNRSSTTGWLLEHERTALLADPLPALVAEQLGRLVEDPALRDRLGAAGRERVAALPPWDAEIDRVWRFMARG